MKIIDVTYIEKSTKSLFFMVTLSYKKMFKTIEKTEKYSLGYGSHGYNVWADSCETGKTPFAVNTVLVQQMIMEYERRQLK